MIAKTILTLVLFLSFALIAEASVPTAANSDMAGATSLPPYDGISELNKTVAKGSYVLSLGLALTTLIVFFIARRHVKTDYKKAKKFFVIGLILFVSAVILFLLPKLFLSYTFPGNFDVRAT